MKLVGLVVDTDKCIGSGMCEMLEEELFLIDEDTNIAGVLGEGQLPEDRAATVIDRCPSSAIRRIEVNASEANETEANEPDATPTEANEPEANATEAND